MKILRVGPAGPGPQRSFLRGAQIAAQLEHPHIIPVYGLGFRSQDGVPFLIMRLVRGSSLAQAIDEYHRLRGPHGRHTARLGRLLHWLVQACDALAFAHERGVIHRDVKPSNILIGPSNEALLADWGLARSIVRPATRAPEVSISVRPELEEELAGTIVGTPAFMAPEQVRGQVDQIDERADIYVMGSSLFQVLTGRPPFPHTEFKGVAQVFEAIVAGPTPCARDRSLGTR